MVPSRNKSGEPAAEPVPSSLEGVGNGMVKAGAEPLPDTAEEGKRGGIRDIKEEAPTRAQTLKNPSREGCLQATAIAENAKRVNKAETAGWNVG